MILEAVFLALFWSWVFAAVLFLRYTLLPKSPLFAAHQQFNLPSELVRFPATDGMPLEGWKIAAEPGRPWIILCHGVGSNRSDVLPVAAGLHAAGFNLLLFDFRAHGGSGGRVTSFGWTERRDLEGALAFLGQQADAPARPYGVYGISMGASVALLTAAADERLGALALDSPYHRLDATLDRHLKLLYPILPAVPFGWWIASTYRLRFGIWPSQVSPEASAARLGQRPLLLIQVAGDVRIPLEATQAILRQASGPKDLWVIQGTEHLSGFAADPAAYLDRLTAFFTSALK